MDLQRRFQSRLRSCGVFWRNCQSAKSTTATTGTKRIARNWESQWAYPSSTAYITQNAIFWKRQSMYCYIHRSYVEFSFYINMCVTFFCCCWWFQCNYFSQKLYTQKILDQYRSALEKAIQISCTFNIPPLPGHTLVICNVCMSSRSRNATDDSYNFCMPQEDTDTIDETQLSASVRREHCLSALWCSFSLLIWSFIVKCISKHITWFLL